MNEERVIALLGRRDEPTDAVEEYCQYLSAALAKLSFKLDIRRVPWSDHGWPASLNALRLQAETWRNTWILVQYTSLAWSSRGFPLRFLRVLRILRKAGARIVVVFHDAQPFGGDRLVDRIRRVVQVRVMRAAVAFSDCSVMTVPLNSIPWLGVVPENVRFIPVGANLPQPLLEQDHTVLHEPPAVAVYSITGGYAGDCETDRIIHSVRYAAKRIGRLRLLVFGRHAEVREGRLRAGLRDCDVVLSVEGVIDGDVVVERFASSDVLLFLRGTISSRRGSAIAGIACGLPVVGLRGPETEAPVTDAGVVLFDDRSNERELNEQFGEALVRILCDQSYRQELAARSQQAGKDSFSWSAIASGYNAILSKLS